MKPRCLYHSEKTADSAYRRVPGLRIPADREAAERKRRETTLALGLSLAVLVAILVLVALGLGWLAPG